MDTPTATVTAPEQTIAQMQVILQKDEVLIAKLVKENAELRLALPMPKVKQVPTAEQFSKAIADMNAEANAEFTSGKVSELAHTSLASFLGFIPEMTDSQKETYYAAKKVIAARYHAFHKGLLKETVRTITKNQDKPGFVLGTKNSKRKNGEFSLARVSLRNTNRTAKKAVKAKPAQVAAHVPAAGNSKPPAAL